LRLQRAILSRQIQDYTDDPAVQLRWHAAMKLTFDISEQWLDRLARQRQVASRDV